MVEMICRIRENDAEYQSEHVENRQMYNTRFQR